MDFEEEKYSNYGLVCMYVRRGHVFGGDGHIFHFKLNILFKNKNSTLLGPKYSVLCMYDELMWRFLPSKSIIKTMNASLSSAVGKLSHFFMLTLLSS